MKVGMKRGVNIKRKLVLVVVTVAFLAGFGALLHSPPSVIDVISGGNTESKKSITSCCTVGRLVHFLF
jgi:hypothetical protein